MVGVAHSKLPGISPSGYITVNDVTDHVCFAHVLYVDVVVLYYDQFGNPGKVEQTEGALNFNLHSVCLAHSLRSSLLSARYLPRC